jgi:hypothetical protein
MSGPRRLERDGPAIGFQDRQQQGAERALIPHFKPGSRSTRMWLPSHSAPSRALPIPETERGLGRSGALTTSAAGMIWVVPCEAPSREHPGRPQADP